jgi:Fe-S-cluster containining protein
MRCGKCCTSFGVCVTPSDIARIAAATGKNPLVFVSTIPEPDARERTEPSVIINGKRSLIVLKWRVGMLCRFYSADGCKIYASRPLLCRTYPFIFKQNKLSDMGSRSCPCLWKPDDETSYSKDLDAYAKEIEAYRKLADEWNTGAGGSLDAFLRFALHSSLSKAL